MLGLDCKSIRAIGSDNRQFGQQDVQAANEVEWYGLVMKSGLIWVIFSLILESAIFKIIWDIAQYNLACKKIR
jgi:hypothetical protein